MWKALSFILELICTTILVIMAMLCFQGGQFITGIICILAAALVNMWRP